MTDAQERLRTRVKAHFKEVQRQLRRTTALHDRLESEEGGGLYAYIDTTGNLTVGYGHNLGRLTLSSGVTVGPNVRLVPVNPITEEIADQILDLDIARVTAELTKALPWGPALGNVRWSVLLDLAFNMGPTRFVHGWPNFLENVRLGAYESAAITMRESKWYDDVHARRADPLIAMMRTGLDT